MPLNSPLKDGFKGKFYVMYIYQIKKHLTKIALGN